MEKLLKGNEKFISIEADPGIKVSDFWSWAYSELLNNIERGALAEFLVLSSFKLSSLEPRMAWQPFDLTSPSGRRIEVKAASYIQSWTEDYYARILFDIGPKSSWNPKLGISPEKKRNSDIYMCFVFTPRLKKMTLYSTWICGIFMCFLHRFWTSQSRRKKRLGYKPY